MKIKNNKRTQLLLLLSLPITLTVMTLLFSGCALKAPKGRIEFHPSASLTEETPGTITEGPFYSRKGERAFFVNNEIRVSVEEARSTGNGNDSTAFEWLHEREFILIKMEIINRSSSKKIRYEPAITALMDSHMGYSKPLDYTRLYEMAMKDEVLDKGFRDFKNSFYDLGVTVMPLQTVSRYLIFKPISKEAKRAELVIKNIYTGMETIDLRFQFELSEAATVDAPRGR